MTLSVPTGDWRRDIDRPPLGTLVGVLNRCLIERVGQLIEEAGGDVSRPAHLYVLRALSPDGASVTQLAERCDVTKQAISQVLGDFEARRLVEITGDPKDARSKIVQLTKRGEAALGLAVLCWGRVEAEWSDVLGGPAEMEHVRAAMLAYLQSIDARPADDQSPRMRPIW